MLTLVTPLMCKLDFFLWSCAAFASEVVETSAWPLRAREPLPASMPLLGNSSVSSGFQLVQGWSPPSPSPVTLGVRLCFLWPVPFPGRRLVTLLQVLPWPCVFSTDLLVCSLGRTVAPAPC